MNEPLPGIFHWTARHERIGREVSSYYLGGERVLIDPMSPPEGLDALPGEAPPAEILLTNRHHYRHSGEFVDAFGCRVRCHRAGLHEFQAGEEVEAFDFGDELPGGVVAHEVGAICPEETALHLPAHRAVAFADGLVRLNGKPLGFVPDFLLGDDPESVKDGLTSAFRRLLGLDFEHLLLAHGGPLVDEGKAALERLVESRTRG